MHGAFVVGLNEMIVSKYGREMWLEILEDAGFEASYRPLSNQEVSDQEVVFLIKTIVKKLNVGEKVFGEMFGDYWIRHFVKEKYFAFLDAFKNVKDLLNQVNEIHRKLTANLNLRKPPHFVLEWENPQSLLMHYKSDRQLINIAVGAIKALGEYYQDDISVFKIDSNKIKVFFSN